MEILYSFLIIGIAIIIPLLGQYLYKRYKLVYIKKMSYDKNNIDERFEEIYSKINNESVKKVEKLRKRIEVNKIIKNIIFVSVFLISIIFNIKYEELTQTLPIESYYLYQSIRVLSIYFIQYGIPLWVIWGSVKSIKRKDYERQYKNSILSSLVNLYDKTYTYKTDSEFIGSNELKNEFVKNKFSLGSGYGIDLVNVKNSIYGKFADNTIMSLYDISVVNGISNSTSGIHINEINSIFKGTYIVLEFDRKIATFVRITKNKLIPRKDKVELDSSEFEKYFDVNSEDKNLAVRILTADVMQILVDFYKKYHLIFEIVLRENKVHINLHTEGAFKVPIYNSIDKGQIYLYYSILEFTTNLSKEINKALNGIEL